MIYWIQKLANIIPVLSNMTGFSEEFILRSVQSLLVLFILVLLRFFSLRIVRNRVDDIKRHYYWRRGINYITGILLVLIIGRIWFRGMQDLSTFLGLLSAGIAIALSDLISNFAGWIFILARRPYQVGDRIELAGHVGDVIDIRLFQTYLMECGNWVHADQSSGRIIGVPNGMIFKNTHANYTTGFEYIWEEIPVLLTFESDWRKAKDILTEIAEVQLTGMSKDAERQIRQAAAKQMIFFQKLTPIVYTDVKDSGVQLTLRYLTHPRQRRGNAQIVWESILDAFAKEDSIDFAYPTVRHYMNVEEGKPGAKAQIQTDKLPDKRAV